MAEHVCKCQDCKPEAFPEVSPRTPGYASVKHDRRIHPKTITVDGEIVDRVFEALSGDQGWVIYFTGHACSCAECVCTDVKYGRVVFGY
jgi:hypothetical protein